MKGIYLIVQKIFKKYEAEGLVGPNSPGRVNGKINNYTPTMGLKNEHVWAIGYAINNRISLLNNPFNELVKILILNI